MAGNDRDHSTYSIAGPAPVASTTWQTHSIDEKYVQETIDLLWSQLQSDESDHAFDDSAGSTNVGAMHASTVNLIVLCESHNAAQEISEFVGRLTEFCPSRTVILVTEESAMKEGELTVSTAVQERSMGQGRPPIRYETVTVIANRDQAASLANVASTLLVPELPDFLWWRSSALLDHPLYGELSDISDRLIIDSSELQPRSRTMRALAQIATSPRSDLRLSDLTWARIAPWRKLIAQHFDNPIALTALDSIHDVFVGYRGAGDLGKSGLPSASLLVGWIASRLKWQSPGELVRDGNGWRVTLRAGKIGSRREVVVRTMPASDAGSLEDLKEVQIRAELNGHSSCSILSVNAAGLLTHNEYGDSPPTSRMIHTRATDAATLLSDELRMFGRDTVFEDALVFAASLLPDGTTE